MSILIPLLAAAAGGAHLVAARRGQERVALVLKPIPVLLFAALVAQGPCREGAGAAWVVAGLLLSAVGDVLLALPRERFLGGLVAFLLAHLCYLGAFLGRGASLGTPWLMSGIALYAGVALRVILPRTGRLAGPVVAYMLAIAGMVWLAGEGWVSGVAGPEAFLGAASFMVSDTLLALDRFVTPLPRRKELVMGPYYLGQYLIAVSCLT